MSLGPRAVVVHRTSEYEELLARHGTRGQAAFFLASHGRDIAEPAGRHHRAAQVRAAVAAAVPPGWRRARVERADLDRFLFAPEDVVVVVGQDGLVANAAKYLKDQPVIGIDTDPGRNPGVLVRHRGEDAARLLRAAGAGRGAYDERTMVEAVTDDGQRLLALNEIYLGHRGHQSARYRIGGEAQASSGILVGTGTGATGWLRSLWQERGGTLPLPDPCLRRLLWFVREAWPSPVTGTTASGGVIADGERLAVTVESERLVAFGDGMEADALDLTWGQTVHLGCAERTLRLLV